MAATRKEIKLKAVMPHIPENKEQKKNLLIDLERIGLIRLSGCLKDEEMVAIMGGQINSRRRSGPTGSSGRRRSGAGCTASKTTDAGCVAGSQLHRRLLRQGAG
jgi:hypothetical protein